MSEEEPRVILPEDIDFLTMLDTGNKTVDLTGYRMLPEEQVERLLGYGYVEYKEGECQITMAGRVALGEYDQALAFLVNELGVDISGVIDDPEA